MNLIRGSLLPTAVLSVLCIVVGGVARGGDGVVGALLGVVIVGAFFASTPMAIGPVIKVSPQLSMLVALMFFLTKVIALVALMVVVLDSDGIGRHLNEKVLGATIIVMTLGWTLSMVRASTKSRQPLFDLDAEDE